MIQNNFKIIVAVYNSSEYIIDCINSIKTQKYKNFQCIIIDDASTDDTHNKAIATIDNDLRFLISRNKTRQGALCNIINGTSALKINKEDIIITVDGDDSLASDDVLEFLNKTYNDNPDIWLTYGEYKTLSGDPSQNAPISNTRKYRKGGTWCTSHLRTYRRKLWELIRDEDFKDANGNYFKIATDLAIMYPMIEAASLKRIKYIQKILLIYNDASPLCEFKVNPQLLGETRAYIENKKEYAEIIGDI